MFDLFIYFSAKNLPPKFNSDFYFQFWVVAQVAIIHKNIHLAKFDNIKNVKETTFKHTSIF